MRLFSFDWFRSTERKEIQKLEVEKSKLEIELLKKQLVKEEPVYQTRPFKKLIYRDGNVTVISWEDDVYTGDVDEASFLKIKLATDINTIIHILTPNMIESSTDMSEELGFIQSSKYILSKNMDFEVENGEIYLKGVNLPIAPIVLASFIEIEEKHRSAAYGSYSTELSDQYEALKMFWRWTALCPIESSRRDLLTFVKANDVQITSNGLLELYRRVNKVGNGDKALVGFVSSKYAEIRKKKKATGDYIVTRNKLGVYGLQKIGTSFEGVQQIGNLKDLYMDLPSMEENIYTDNYTHTKKIRIGEVYKEDEDKIDLDNTHDCSNGLHVGGRRFGFEGAGDTGVMVLVNPMKVRAVPQYTTTKMRVSEMFIVGLMEEEKYKTQKGLDEIADFSQEYFNISVEELDKLLSERRYEDLGCQGNNPAVALEDILDITETLKQRVIEI